MGFRAYTVEEFADSHYAKGAAFDSLLVAHVLEHMARADAMALVQRHMQYLRPGGQLVLISPQEKGFRSDPTHVEFVDFTGLRAIANAAGADIVRSFSFPLPRRAGKVFPYNEFVVVGRTEVAAPEAPNI
jgi:hypothetical protein